MSDKEKFAWRKLKIADTNDEIYDVPSNMSISEKIEASRKRKRKSKSETYMNTRFILESAAEIERYFQSQERL